MVAPTKESNRTVDWDCVRQPYKLRAMSKGHFADSKVTGISSQQR